MYTSRPESPAPLLCALPCRSAPTSLLSQAAVTPSWGGGRAAAGQVALIRRLASERSLAVDFAQRHREADAEKVIDKQRSFLDDPTSPLLLTRTGVPLYPFISCNNPALL